MDHKEQQTGLQVYSWVRKRGEVQAIDKMPGKLQERHRGHEELEVRVERPSPPWTVFFLLGFQPCYFGALKLYLHPGKICITKGCPTGSMDSKLGEDGFFFFNLQYVILNGNW